MLEIDASIIHGLNNVGFPFLGYAQIRLTHHCILHMIYVVSQVQDIVIVPLIRRSLILNY